jgi:hypothetical protein
MFLLSLIGAVFLFSACTSYEDSTHDGSPTQDGWYGGQDAYQKTGQPINALGLAASI